MSFATLFENTDFQGRTLEVDGYLEIPREHFMYEGASSVKIHSREWIAFIAEHKELWIRGPIDCPNLHDVHRYADGGVLSWVLDGHWGDRIRIVSPQGVQWYPRHRWQKDVSIWPVVRAHQHAEFSGATQDFPCGMYRADHGDLYWVGDKSISAVAVPDGLKVTLWEHAGPLGQWTGAGASASFGPGFHVVGPMNDKTSFLVVETSR